jgi:hypothetical protein
MRCCDTLMGALTWPRKIREGVCEEKTFYGRIWGRGVRSGRTFQERNKGMSRIPEVAKT